MEKYRPTIGMEVHVELATESKMFCSCKNGMGQEPVPNKNICPVCTGQPGALPTPNRKALEFLVQAGLALNCKVNRKSRFHRKNYFYPDLPKGYQISQYEPPLCQQGFLEFTVSGKNGQEPYLKRVGIHRIHMEEDTGKLLHGDKGETLVDYNRSGVPLMELVTEPDINSAAEARAFCENLQLLLRAINVSPADMEKGQMRCEANVSLYRPHEDPLSGTKVELKNINSFRAVEKGIEYEIERQSEVLEEGGNVIQETRGWDENRNETFSQRTKEDAHDYRYFPEPDLRRIIFEEEEIELLKRKLPELPAAKKNRLIEQYGLREESAEFLARSRDLANFFEQVTSELENWLKAEGHKFKEEDHPEIYRLAANYITTELQKLLTQEEQEISDLKVTAENFAELIKIIFQGEINSSSAQLVMLELVKKGGDPSDIIRDNDLAQTSDQDTLRKVVEKVIFQNPSSVEDYRAGKERALKFLMGQVMKETKGKANPQLAMTIIKDELK